MNLRSNGKSMCFPTDSQFYSAPTPLLAIQYTYAHILEPV